MARVIHIIGADAPAEMLDQVLALTDPGETIVSIGPLRGSGQIDRKIISLRAPLDLAPLVSLQFRKLIGTADVIHAWAMPAFGVKQDGVPGRLAELWFNVEREGIYFGQCSELCGKDHTYMPITVEVVSQPDYDAWVQTQQALNDTAPVAEPTKLAANK